MTPTYTVQDLRADLDHFGISVRELSEYIPWHQRTIQGWLYREELPAPAVVILQLHFGAMYASEQIHKGER